MSGTAQHLDTLESLCALPFPDADSPGAYESSGPRHHLVTLLLAPAESGEDTATTVFEEQFETEREALSLLLTVRGWGPPDRFALTGAALRAGGEPLPAPWDHLVHTVPDVHLWRRAERWTGIGTAHHGPGLPLALVAFTTTEDPP
ncbi:hypothetical protein [Streptomyces sp. NRRL F-5630]|uniref:hypothetical protein n=1 Tax=unclassified Streptomyces TaxID=2593676 RepID=UPI0004CA3E88|nr:hypothetical protein [Streptomyces sp. NRRL F-5630]